MNRELREQFELAKKEYPNLPETEQMRLARLWLREERREQRCDNIAAARFEEAAYGRD